MVGYTETTKATMQIIFLHIVLLFLEYEYWYYNILAKVFQAYNRHTV